MNKQELRAVLSEFLPRPDGDRSAEYRQDWKRVILSLTAGAWTEVRVKGFAIASDIPRSSGAMIVALKEPSTAQDYTPLFPGGEIRSGNGFERFWVSCTVTGSYSIQVAQVQHAQAKRVTTVATDSLYPLVTQGYAGARTDQVWTENGAAAIKKAYAVMPLGVGPFVLILAQPGKKLRLLAATINSGNVAQTVTLQDGAGAPLFRAYMSAATTISIGSTCPIPDTAAGQSLDVAGLAAAGHIEMAWVEV